MREENTPLIDNPKFLIPLGITWIVWIGSEVLMKKKFCDEVAAQQEQVMIFCSGIFVTLYGIYRACRNPTPHYPPYYAGATLNRVTDDRRSSAIGIIQATRSL
jgi:hypothetical protein